MAHLIETIRGSSIPNAIDALRRAHSFIVNQAITAQANIGTDPSTWGSSLKRIEVLLPANEELIGKTSEKFVEVINILATTERTISALMWLSREYPDCLLRECHASTSDDVGGSDIVLVDKNLSVIARCEVTDVISSNAGQNKKEKKDLKNLGCEYQVPADETARYIATSTEFATALTSMNRNWHSMHYRYIKHETNFTDQTILLEIKSNA